MLTGPTALYRFYDSSEQLLYIGITCDLDRRWREHSGQSAWWPDVYRSAVEWYEDRYEAEEAEKAAIRAENPQYNVMYGPASHMSTAWQPPTLEGLRARYGLLAERCPERHDLYPRIQRMGRRVARDDLRPELIRDLQYLVNLWLERLLREEEEAEEARYAARCGCPLHSGN